jgi:fused signal recognition particle receptor
MNDTTPENTKLSWWRRLSSGLKRTSSSIGTAVADLVTKRKLGRALLEDIEDVLLRADLGTEVSARIAARVGTGRYDQAISADEVKAVVAAEVEKVLAPVAKPLVIDETQKPFVVLVVGVNGSGKTTTIGKLAAKLSAEGRKVMLAAGDTFRAAAIEQLNNRLSYQVRKARIPRALRSTRCQRRASKSSTCCWSIPPAVCRTRPN